MIEMMWREVRENLKRAVLWMIALIIGAAYAAIDGELESGGGGRLVGFAFPASWCSRRFEQALNVFLSEALALSFTPDEIRQAVDHKLSDMGAGRATERGRRNE